MSNVRNRWGTEPALAGQGRGAAAQSARRWFEGALRTGWALSAAPLAACSVYSDDLLSIDTWDGSGGRPVDAAGEGLPRSGDASDEERRTDSDGADRADGSRFPDAGGSDRNTGGTGGVDGASGAGGASGAAGAGGTSGAAGTSGAGGAGGGDADFADIAADVESGTPRSDVASDGAGRDGGCTGPTSPHDEDGDGVDDACDNCPSVANANQADQGEIGAGLIADGVGDACDPRPNLGGESILLFDPLTSGQLGAAWSVYAGTWVAGADTVAETAVGSSQEIDRTDLTTATDYLAETRFRFDSLPSLDSRMTLPFRMDTSVHNGWGCAMTNRSLLALSTIVNGAAGETAPPTTPIAALQVGTRYRVWAGAHGPNVYCILPDTGDRITRPSTSPPMGTAGLRTHLAAATFEYLLVYRLGGPLP